jgi:hypothetical protein
MKTGTLLTAIITSGIFLSAGISMATTGEGAETITLKGGSLGSVTFPHERHQEIFIDCMPCHKLYPKEPQIIDTMKAESKLKRKEVMNMCKNCHKDLAGKGQKTGPTSCGGCHKK